MNPRSLLALALLAALGCAPLPPAWRPLVVAPTGPAPLADRTGSPPAAPGAPSVVLASAARIDALATGAGDLLVGLGAHVVRVPRAGGPPTKIGTSDGSGCLAPLVAGKTALYCQSPSGADLRLLQLPLVGGQTLALDVLSGGERAAVGDLAVANGGLYLVAIRGGRESALVRVPLAGGARELVVDWGGVAGTALAADAAHVYYVSNLGLARLPIAGGPPEVLGTGAYHLALTATDVYFASGRGIERMAKGQTALTLLVQVPNSAVLPEPPVRALAADDRHFFWIERRADPLGRPVFALLRGNLDGSGILVLATSASSMTSLLLDDANVFWIEERGGGGAVLALPKEVVIPGALVAR